MRWWLLAVFGLVALLGANSLYLVSLTLLEWVKGFSYQNYFYQLMFLTHLVLGLLLLVPFVVFTTVHLKATFERRNRRAVQAGYLLLGFSLVLLVSGIALMRVEGFELKNPSLRSAAYWAHVLTPVGVVWLYVLHRLAGPRIKWKVGLAWAGAVGVVTVAMVSLHATDPRKWSVVGPKEGEQYFHPSRARTATGNFIPAKTLMMDQYCQQCHEDGYKGWFHSSHHFSSFNNPPYLASVKETREVALKRDGNVKAARWCAGCHDPVPFFSGAFDDPQFDLENHPTAKAGITCTACHSIVNVNSTVGNADFTIEEPIHYPFAGSTNRVLAFLNRQLVKGKPDFHKKTFLKPLHRSSEFCSTCHKVSIPGELNHYKPWLRGQNHYDGFLLSGVSGHGARSFYYPDVARENCASCHMPLQASADFGAKFFNPTNQTLAIHDHLFPSANTGVPHLRGDAETVKAHQAFLKDSVRLDIVGVKEGGTIDGRLHAPLRPRLPVLQRGKTYLIEVVVRTMKLGHPFTQGTVDSNEVWVDARVTGRDQVFGRSGGLGDQQSVDPWAHFLNVYMLDKDGQRIDRRNVQDIFTPLYDHQIPPGAAQVVHYTFTVPEDAPETLDVEVKLNYRKFDAKFMQFVKGTNFVNDLPITVVGSDKVTFPVGPQAGEHQTVETHAVSPIPEWQRWNDYGIGLLNEGEKGSEKGELIQAAHAFAQVERLKRPDGPVNLARVYYKEGRLDDAVRALQRAAKFDPPAPRWLVAWFSGLVNKQNGYLDQAISEFRSVLEDRYPELEKRRFDFSKDYVVINELAQTLFERSKQERADPAKRKELLASARDRFLDTLNLDSENLTAHYNLALIYEQLDEPAKAQAHRVLHERYRPDDNARDHAILAERRRNPAADHAAQAIVLYPLQRPGAPELTSRPEAATLSASN